MASINDNQKATLISKIVVSNLIKNYEDMALSVNKLIELNPQLNEEELNWLSIAYKHCVNGRINSWHIVKSAMDKERAVNNLPHIYKAEGMLKEIETEIRRYGNDILDLLEEKIIPNTEDHSLMVSCWKLVGDHKRFLSVIETGDKKHEMIEQSQTAYERGYKLAIQKLDDNNPAFLALVLNYSLFLHEIIKNKKMALEIVMTTRELMRNVQLNKKSTYILERLDDNMKQWGGIIETNTENPFHELF